MVDVVADPEEGRSAAYYEALHGFQIRVSRLRVRAAATAGEAGRLRKKLQELAQSSDARGRAASLLRRELDDAAGLLDQWAVVTDPAQARLSILDFITFVRYSLWELPTKDWDARLSEVESRLKAVLSRLQDLAPKIAQLEKSPN